MRLGERRVSATKSKDIKLTIEYVDKHGEPVKRGFLVNSSASRSEMNEIIYAIGSAIDKASEEAK